MDGSIGEIRIFAFNFVPNNYIICDGRRLEKKKNKLLYEVLGDSFTYDDSDPDTFAIPDLRDRFVRHAGTDIRLGEQKGADEIVLSVDQMPEHNHNVHIEVDNTNGNEEAVNTPNNAFLNNNAANFSSAPSENTFLGGISQEKVGKSEPVAIKNAHVKMVYAIRSIYDEPTEGIIGEIRIWPNSKIGVGEGFIPRGWRLCNGDTFSAGNTPLLSIIGDKYGLGENGDPKLPDFRNRWAVGADADDKVGQKGGNTQTRITLNQLARHTHNVQLNVNNDAQSVEVQTPIDSYINDNAGRFSLEVTSEANLGGIIEKNRGGQEDIDITNPSLGLNYIICVSGVYNLNSANTYLGEIKMYAGYDIRQISRTGFQFCYGQHVRIHDIPSLFSLLRNHYGGDDKTFFALPDLRHKIPLCVNDASEIGTAAGANHIRLTPDNLPEHDHDVQLAANHTSTGRLVNIPNGILNNDAGPYSTKESANAQLGGVKETHFLGEEIDIRNPFLTINYLICTNGTYPQRNDDSN